MTADGISPQNSTLLEKNKIILKEKLTAQDDNKEVIFHEKKQHLDVDNIGHGVCVNPVKKYIQQNTFTKENHELTTSLCQVFCVKMNSFITLREEPTTLFTKPVLCKAV